MKRKIHLIILILQVCLSCSSVLASDYKGKYVTKPSTFPGFSEPYSEQVEKAIKHMTWNLEITEKEIIWWVDKEKEPEVMPYTKDGDFLLAREETPKIIKYVPFYIENDEIIHGLNTIFFKENE